MVLWKEPRSSYELAIQRLPLIEGARPKITDRKYLGWLSRHGAATVKWSCDRPSYIWLPDEGQGRTIELQHSHDGVWRKIIKSPESFSWVSVELAENSILCGDIIYEIPFDFSSENLYFYIHNNISDFPIRGSYSYCISFFEALNNTAWRKGSDLSGFGWRDLGQFIAHVRQTGNMYTDFLAMSRDDYVLEDGEFWVGREVIHRSIENMGWRRVQ